jgi:N-acyl-D-aspartate/D-glutamate deacylase
MSLDLKIVGGTVVDGTGAPGKRADVGVKDGRIVAVGEVSESAARTLDAEGALVTPGFVDLHCHYDGQVSWDEELAPSVFHGVTTCLLGNCGVGFAPVRERDRKRLLELMEGVEDIPGSVLAEGIRWRWETFEEYMDAVDSFPHAIDFALQVTHDPLRVYVMGERALANEAATPADIAEMRRLVRRALEAGAAGFSTGRSDNHRSIHGEATPASEANKAELAGIAEAFHGLGHGILQAVSDFDMEKGDERFDGEFDVLEAMLAASGGHPLAVSLSQRDMAPNQWRRILGRAEACKQKGLDLRVLVAPRGIGVLLGLEATFHPFVGFPGYKEISHLPLAERVAAMREPERKARILSEKSDKIAGDGSAVPPLADKLLERLDVVAMRLFRLGEHPDYEQPIEKSLYAEALAKGKPPLEAVYDALLESEGHELLYFPIFNYTEFSLDNVQAMIEHPLSLPGLSDGGAHVGTICDASFPSYFLTHWGRDRARGRMPVEQVIRYLTSAGADFLGLADRGRVAVGQRADLNVLEFDSLRLERPRLVHDLPGGGKRLLQNARGYRATLVHGQVVVERDRLTGARPGRLARLGVAGRAS